MHTCPHANIVLCTEGGWHFSPEAGPWDDIREYLLCLNCLQEVEPVETGTTTIETILF